MTWWHRLWNRQRMEADLEKELRFHLEQHTEELISRGYDRQEARRLARLTFGGPEQVKEDCRDVCGTQWLEDFWQDFRYALRTLRQKPGFSAVALLTLALGIGATTVMFTVINGVLLKPLPYPEPDKLVTLSEQTDKYGAQWVSYPNFLDCKHESRTLTMAAWTYSGGTVSEPGDAAYVSGRRISSELFSVLGIPLLEGRAFLPEEDRAGAAPVIIISHNLWHRRFAGSPGTVGKRIVFDGKSYTIVGVAPADFRLFGGLDVLTPLGQNTEIRMQNREASFLRVVARLQPGVTLAAAQTELPLIGRHLAELYPKSNAGRGFLLRPLHQELVGDVRSTLWLLLGAVGMVLLIACVNVASLLLARAVSRERELAMRMALGAGRGRLVRQCLTESAVLGLSGGMLGIFLAVMGIRPFLAFWPGNLPRAEEIQLDWRVLLFALTISLLSGLLFGLAPALRAPSRDLEQTLRAGARTVAGSSRRLHSGLVISEIALAMVLLVSAGMLARTFLLLSSLDPGINVRSTLVTRVGLSPTVLENPARIRAAWQELLDRARRVPGVESVALADVVPMRDGVNELGYWTAPTQPPPNEIPLALATSVTPDYLKVMGIPLRHGRFFDEQDRLGNEPVVVIDEVLAQHAFGAQEPIGKRLWLQAIGRSKVVGVVGHVRHWGLAGDDQAKVRAQLYYPFAQVPDPLMRLFASFMSTTVRTNITPSNMVEPLQRELRGAAGDQVLYEARSMEQLASGSLTRHRFLLLLFGVFSGLALLLACIGIYGVLAYLNSQRIPEFGLRMALGASAANVKQLVLRQSLRMVLAGIAIGMIAAWGAGTILQRFVEGMHSNEIATFAVMTFALVAATLFATFLPARRASRVDPIQALRQE